MYITGFLSIIVVSVAIPLFTNDSGWINIDCGYRQNQLYFLPIGNRNLSKYSILAPMTIPLILLWDIITYALYLCKIWSFIKYKGDDTNEAAIKERILSILYKITIITSFYEILALIGVILYTAIGIIYGTDSAIYAVLQRMIGSTNSVSLSYCMNFAT